MTSKKIIGWGTIIVIVSLFILFKVEKIPQYKTTTLKNDQIIETVDFTDKIMPNKLSKIDLGSYDNIKKIVVHPGDKVKKGQIIAYLDDTDEKRAYDNAWKSYNSAILARNSMRNLSDTFDDYIDTSYESIKSLTDIIDLLKENVPDENADNIPDDLDKQVETTLTALKVSYTSLVSSTSSFGSIGQSAVNLAYANLTNAKANLEKTKIKSPISGVVLVAIKNNYDKNSGSSSLSSLSNMASMLGSSDFDMESLLNGSMPSSSDFNPANQNVIYIADQKHWYIYPSLIQNDIVKVKKGQEAIIKIKGLKNTLKAKVVEIYPIATSLNSDEVSYKIKVEVVDQVPENIFPGMNVDGSIIINKKNNAKLVPIEAIFYDENSEPYVNVLTDHGVESKYITLGIRSDTYVEVLDGLSDNDQIIIQELPPKSKIKFRFSK